MATDKVTIGKMDVEFFAGGTCDIKIEGWIEPYDFEAFKVNLADAYRIYLISLSGKVKPVVTNEKVKV